MVSILSRERRLINNTWRDLFISLGLRCQIGKSLFTLQMWEFIPSLRRRQWQPTLLLLPGQSRGQTSLVGCGPRGR